MNTTPETTSATGHSADHARDELVPEAAVDAALVAEGAYLAERDAARREGSQRLFGHPGASIPSAFPDARDAMRAALSAALPVMRAEVLAPVAAIVEAWSRPAEVKASTAFQVGVKVGIDSGVDDVLADLRAVLADPDAVSAIARYRFLTESVVRPDLDAVAECTCGAVESGAMAQHLEPCPLARIAPEAGR